MSLPHFTLFTALLLTISSSAFQVHAANGRYDLSLKPSSPFSIALDSLQAEMNYTFSSVGLLRRALTHASYSEENNRALSILGSNVIETSASLYYLVNDLEISAKDLNRHVSEISKVESSCAVDGMRLGLQKIIRVSPKTDPSTPAVVCCAVRAIFGAIAIDTGKSDDAGRVFWKVHGLRFGKDLPL